MSTGPITDPATISGLTSYRDRHGHRRWRLRVGGRQVALPGAPGVPEFETRLADLLARPADAPPTLAEPQPVARLAPAVKPRSMRHAWRLYADLSTSPRWTRLDQVTRDQYLSYAERFLAAPTIAEDPASPPFGDILVEHLHRRHVKAILARWSGTPHAATRVLRVLRRICDVAIDQEWITIDPTYGVEWAPEYDGWRAWTDSEMADYEAHWPVGTTPRLVYALALWTGQRRSDVVRMRWDHLREGGIDVVQKKGGKALWVPIHPELRLVLEATPRRHDVIIVTQYGRPFSDKAIGMRMQEWTAKAGIAAGATIHGLRKTLGRLLAENGATTRQLMEILGHDAIEHAELYSRAAEQRVLARDGMAKIPSRSRPRPA